jgi:hypothetical protein
MNQNSGAAAGVSNGENKKRSFEGKMVNGEPRTAPGTPTFNGGPPKGPSSALAVSAPLVPTPDALAELPPEIAHISQEHYLPLSTLLLRISQETYNDLSETLQAMAQMPLAPQTNGVMANGAGAHRNAQENEETNRRKKLLLMKFAQENRAKFIKLLVLTEWGKKASAPVSKLIDLFAWATAQKDCCRAEPRYRHCNRDSLDRKSAVDANIGLYSTRADIVRTGPEAPTLYQHHNVNTAERPREPPTTPAELADRVWTCYIRHGERPRV